MKKHLFIGIILIAVSSNINWPNDNWKSIIVHDVKGYYAYLPAVFIYQDLNFGFFETIEKRYYAEHNSSDYRNIIDGKAVNKYYIGTAILQLPFFALGHAVTYVMDGWMDIQSIMPFLST